MSDDHSDGEGNGGHEADPVDMTEDMEIELNLPREVDEEPARRSDIDLSPRTGPDLNGPDTDCPSRVLWNLVAQ